MRAVFYDTPKEHRIWSPFLSFGFKSANLPYFSLNRPVYRGRNKKQKRVMYRLRRNILYCLNGASVCLPFRARDTGSLTTKYRQFQTETSKRRANCVFSRHRIMPQALRILIKRADLIVFDDEHQVSNWKYAFSLHY